MRYLLNISLLCNLYCKVKLRRQCQLIQYAMSSKGKPSKSIDVISALRAFETTLRAACRHSGVPVYRPLLDELVKGQETSKPLTAVIVSGSVHGAHIAAVADCLASYAAAKSLNCLGCSVGDKGLAAIAALLQASGSKWWHGARLQTLEISNDSGQRGCTAAPHAAAVLAAGSGVHCNAYTERNTTQAQTAALRPATAPPPQASTRQQSQPHLARPCTGICPPLPGYLQQQDDAQQAQDDLRLGALRQIHYKVRSPKTIMEIRTWALAPTLGASQQQHIAAGSPPSGSPTAASSSQSPPACPSCSFSAGPLQQLSLALGVTSLQLQKLVLDHTTIADEGISILAAGLGSCSSLKVLSLRYCSIGPAGAQQLVEALVPACKKQLGSSGSATSGAAGQTSSRMSMRAVNPQLALAAPAATDTAGGSPAAGKHSSTVPASGSTSADSSAQASRQPLLLSLHLDGNPLGAAGLHTVNRAVRQMSSIKVLTLADIDLDCSLQPVQLEVQVLAHSLLAGPNELNTLDFTDNHISDECALYFVGLLKGKPSVTLLKLTPRLSANIMQQLTELLEEHQRAARAARTKKKPKKAAK